MYLNIVCLNELNRHYFYLLPLRLLLLPLNKNCFSNIVDFCVYIINTTIHSCLEIWNFSSRVQFDISRVSVADERHITLNTGREIPYLRVPMYNKNIIILKPGKGNGVVIMDRNVYDNCCLIIINDQSKFKLLNKDPTLNRESKLQRFLRNLKSKGYPTGSQPARFYGLPKLHKKREANSPPPFRPIVSSIGAYNYKLAKYLVSILSPYIRGNNRLHKIHFVCRGISKS